jgi:hypothetical protein
MASLANELKVNSAGNLVSGKSGAKLQTDIEKASYDIAGNLKPSAFFYGDSVTYYLYYLEGIEGLHNRLSEYVVENDPKHKPKLLYLNHGYFKLKPAFLPATYTGTTDPQLKRRNGYISGIYQIYDVVNKCEGILWCYGASQGSVMWERLQVQIEHALNQVKLAGITTVDEHGYLPAIFKIGKMPTKIGSKYAKIVSWDFKVCEITQEKFRLIDSPVAMDLYSQFPPMFSNEYEDKDGVKLFRSQT